MSIIVNSIKSGFFLIPNSDYIKSTVARNYLISVGDLKEGFNQVDNEPETRKKMAALSAGGCWLPRGLTFGPTNGPEDFQELVFTVFQRRLYKDWFLFVVSRQDGKSVMVMARRKLTTSLATCEQRPRARRRGDV